MVKSFFRPQLSMGKTEAIFLILLFVLWIIWSAFSVHESDNPPLESIFRFWSLGFFVLGFWCSFLGRKAVKEERSTVFYLYGSAMALCFGFGAFPLTMMLLFHSPSILLRVTGFFLWLFLAGGIILWCFIDFCRKLEEQKGVLNILFAVLITIPLLCSMLSGGIQFCVLLRLLLQEDREKKEKTQLVCFLLFGSLLFWTAVWLRGAGFIWLPEGGIRYGFYGFWVIGYMAAIVTNLFLIWPLLFIWLKRWSWKLAWGVMILFSLAFLGWGAYENRPERYLQAEFRTLPESIRLEGMEVTQLLDRHGGGVFFLLQGDGVAELTETLIRQLDLKERNLTTRYFVPESMCGDLPPEISGWRDSRAKCNNQLYLDQEKNRLYYFRTN